MAYCNECGAYIPDGQTVCLACGYDPSKVKTRDRKTAEKNGRTTSSGGFAYEFDTSALKEEIEKQKQRIKEESRKWAEEEKARREAQKENQAEPARDNKTGSQMSEGSLRILSAISYLGALFIVPFVFAGDSEYAKFHAKQGVKLFVFGIICDIITGIIPLGAILSLFRFYLIYKGMSAALNNRMEALPFIGNLW